jgi:hypothetical protein
MEITTIDDAIAEYQMLKIRLNSLANYETYTSIMKVAIQIREIYYLKAKSCRDRESKAELKRGHLRWKAEVERLKLIVNSFPDSPYYRKPVIKSQV